MRAFCDNVFVQSRILPEVGMHGKAGFFFCGSCLIFRSDSQVKF